MNFMNYAILYYKLYNNMILLSIQYAWQISLASRQQLKSVAIFHETPERKVFLFNDDSDLCI